MTPQLDFIKQQNIAFIGAGNMSAAIIGGLISMGMPSQQILACNPSRPKLEQLEDSYKIKISQDNHTATQWADILIFAVKPQKMADVCKDLQPSLKRDKHSTSDASTPLIISIAAGTTIDAITQWIGQYPIIRSMPNTPSLIQTGATGLYANEFVNSKQQQLAEELFSAVGLTVWVENERLINAVTAVSGSGPAYFFYFMEAMQAAGEQLGLPSDIAKQLTLQTALGAAQMACQGDLSPKTLRERVTSPGGTTQAALTSLANDDFETTISRALKAADKRADELASTFGKKG